jgi:hypothetical protein
MTEQAHPQRGLAGAFALCALATLVLLASHPAPAARGLAELLQAEARDRLRDALVHGGFIATLSVLIVCFVLLSRRLGGARMPVVAGLVMFSLGCELVILSMIIDGFAVPAIATRFSGALERDELRSAETLPAGLLFQAAAIACWSAVMVRGRGRPRAVGVLGAATAAFLAAVVVAVPPPLGQHLLLGGIVLQSVWYLGIAALLLDRSDWPAPPSRS